MDTGADQIVKNDELQQLQGNELLPRPADDRVTTYKKLTALAALLRDTPYEAPIWTPCERDNAEWAATSPQAVFDSLTLNLMTEIRSIAISGERPDINKLSLIIHLAATSMSERLIDELFTPFWLTVWAVNKKDYPILGDNKPLIDLSDAQRQNLYVQLCRKVKPDATFAKRILDLTATFDTFGLKETVKSLQTATATWHRYTDDVLREVAQYLAENKTSIPAAKPLALKALMCMASPAWTDEAADYLQAGIRPFGGITWHMIEKQLANIYAGAPESDKIFDALSAHTKADDIDTAMRSYFWDQLMRKGLYRKEIIQHTVKNVSPATRRIFDHVPLKDYTDEETGQIGYDKDVVRFTLEATKTGVDRIPYKVSSISQQKILLIVPDIKERFIGKNLLLPIIDPTGTMSVEYRPFAVTAEKHALLKPLAVKAKRTDGANLPLPLSGKMEIVNPDGSVVEQWEYTAQESNQLWTAVEIWPQHIQTRLLNMANNHQRLLTNGISCHATIEPDERQERYYRQIVLSRGEGIPAYSSLAMLADEESNVIDKIDTTSATPLEYRLELFKPSLDMSAASTASPRYAVYGYGYGTVSLWTDAVNLSAGQKLTETSSFTTMRVSETEPFGEAFAELHVTLLSGKTKIPPYGILRNLDSEGGEKIPYVGAFKRDDYFVLRIDDPEWTARLANEPDKVIDELKNRTHYIGSQRVRILTTELLQHVAGSQKIIVNVTPAQLSALPLEGRLTVTAPDGTKPNLRYLSQTRLQTTVIPRLKYIGAGPNGFPQFTTDFDGRLNTLPSKMYAKFPGMSRVGILRRLPSKAGETMTFEYEETGRGFTSSVLNTAMMCYCPVNNEPAKPLFEVKSSYRVNDVHYRLFVNKANQDRALRMPAPESPVEGLYYKVGNNSPVEITEENIKRKQITTNPYYDLLNIKIDPTLKVDPEGTVRFYYDKEGTHPAVLTYERLISQIELNAPWKYHADTCALIHQEANACGYFTEQVCEMLKAHSRAEMLRREYIGDPEGARMRKYPETLTFNIGYVTSVNGDRSIICMPTAEQTMRQGSADGTVEAGMLVMVEQNGDIYPFEATEGVRIPEMGFRNGTVCANQTNDGDLLIRDDNGEEFLFIPEGTEIPEKGTEVNFFAVNYPHSRKRNAVLVAPCTEC